MLVRLLVVLLLLAPTVSRAASAPCMRGTPGEQAADAAAVRATLGDIDAACPCASYVAGTRSQYRGCARDVITQRTEASALRAECSRAVRRIVNSSTCGASGVDPVACVRRRAGDGAVFCAINSTARCITTALGVAPITKRACSGFARCLDAADTNADLTIAGPADSGECAPRCGDGTRHPDEQCDDGNTVSGDGCDATCRLEATCDPDGTYHFAIPLQYVCGDPAAPLFTRTIDRLTFSDDGGRIDLGLPGVPPAGSPLSCTGSPIDRSDVEIAPGLIECFLVARVRGSFPSTTTVAGTLEAGLQGYLGGPCFSGLCPTTTVGTFTAVR